MRNEPGSHHGGVSTPPASTCDAGTQPGGVLAAAGRSEHGAEVAATHSWSISGWIQHSTATPDDPRPPCAPSGAALADA